ncbi:hypothetical protein H8356DRAFT_1353654 [Neocallimastix lanati (nom. inval.)]|nr:hypothetical protein H8356DRAFT_1353654 [Neocallimastix sp. JGI-2020a]
MYRFCNNNSLVYILNYNTCPTLSSPQLGQTSYKENLENGHQVGSTQNRTCPLSRHGNIVVVTTLPYTLTIEIKRYRHFVLEVHNEAFNNNIKILYLKPFDSDNCNEIFTNVMPIMISGYYNMIKSKCTIEPTFFKNSDNNINLQEVIIYELEELHIRYNITKLDFLKPEDVWFSDDKKKSITKIKNEKDITSLNKCRTLYIISFLMCSIGTVGIQLTDSPYDVISMRNISDIKQIFPYIIRSVGKKVLEILNIKEFILYICSFNHEIKISNPLYERKFKRRSKNY